MVQQQTCDVRRTLQRRISSGVLRLTKRLKKVRQKYLRRRRKREWDKIAYPFAYCEFSERYVVRSDDQIIGRKLFITGEFDFEKFVAALSALQRDSVGLLVDVGANVGSVCIPAIVRGYARKAAAFEPEPLNFALLEVNCRWNGVVERLALHPYALSAQNGFGGLSYPTASNFGDVRVSQGSFDERLIQTRRFDDLELNLNPERDLIWMDVQGHEMDVLEGMRQQLARRVPLVMEFWPYELARAGSIDRLLSLLEDYDAFVDLSLPEQEWQPLEDLRGAWNARIDNENDFTDLLVASRADVS